MSNVIKARLPGIMGKIIKKSIEIPVNSNAVITFDWGILSIEHGRPSVLVIKDKGRLPKEFRPIENFDVAAFTEDRAMFYIGEFEGLAGIYAYKNGRLIKDF